MLPHDLAHVIFLSSHFWILPTTRVLETDDESSGYENICSALIVGLSRNTPGRLQREVDINVLDFIAPVSQDIVKERLKRNYAPPCEINCITDKGIVLETEYNMVSDNRSDQQMSVEKELAVCDVCGSVITAREHLRWLYDKLGPIASANPTLMLSSFKTLKVAEEPVDKPEQREPGDVSRADRMRILCPVCRAKVSVLI